MMPTGPFDTVMRLEKESDGCPDCRHEASGKRILCTPHQRSIAQAYADLEN